MRCSGSPTTSTAAEPNGTADAARATVAAILFRELLRPLANGLGPLAEFALVPLAEKIARVRKP